MEDNKVVDIDLGATEPMLAFFSSEDLTPDKRPVNEHFRFLAIQACLLIPRNPERTVMLRKLLESRDCALRAGRRQSNAKPSG